MDAEYSELRTNGGENHDMRNMEYDSINNNLVECMHICRNPVCRRSQFSRKPAG